MGTRGAYGFRADETDKLAYNHFDSYPEGLGVELLKQLRAMDLPLLSLPVLKDKALAIQLVSNQGKRPTKEQVARAKELDLCDFTVSEQSENDWYCVLRKMQGDLAKTLEMGVMENHSNFVNDSLFCEWAYIVNVDTGKLEVYQGFNHGKRSGKGWKPEHSEGRYATVLPAGEAEKAKQCGHEPYFGVWLVKEYPLYQLPTDEVFLAEIEALTGEKETA